ncbi:MAG: DUF945 family protein [Pseudomonadota bacterium]
MRKLILILSTLMIVIALGGPVLTGHYAERIVREGQPIVADSLPDWLQLVESSYERGWFNATASHRLLVTDPERAGMLRDWLSDGDFGDQPAIVVHSTINHGPIVNIATLALADVRSRLSVDGGEAGKELPALLNTRIGLNGETGFRVLVADGAFSRPQGDVSWSRVAIAYAPAPVSDPFVLEFTADALQYTGAQSASLIEDVQTTLTLTNSEPGKTLHAQYTANAISTSGAAAAVQGTLSLDGLTAEFLIAARNLITARQQSAGQDPWALLEANATSIRAGFATPLSLDWQQDLQAADGSLDLALAVDTPAANIVPLAANVQTFLQTMANNSDLTLTAHTNEGYLQSVATENPGVADQVAMLKGVGALQRDGDGDAYSMTVTGKDGALLLNGRPMLNSAPR